VYIEELPSGVRPVIGVATSITAFVGYAARGPENVAVRLASFGDYERRFGGLDHESELGFAVQQFFRNGGGDAIVVRVPKLGAVKGTISILDGTANDAKVALELEATSSGSWSSGLVVEVDTTGTSDSDSFNLTITDTGSGVTERSTDLSIALASPRSAFARLNDPDQRSDLVNALVPASQPKPPLANGTEGADLAFAPADLETDGTLKADRRRRAGRRHRARQDDGAPPLGRRHDLRRRRDGGPTSGRRVRFCWVPPNSATPRRYRCQPDLPVAAVAPAPAPAGLVARPSATAWWPVSAPYRGLDNQFFRFEIHVGGPPGILAVSREPFIVFASNAFAILGLRAMYFLLGDARERFHYLSHALGAILVFVGVKMALSHWWHLPATASLAVIVGIVIAAIVFSVRKKRGDTPPQPLESERDTGLPTPAAPRVGG
jgi:hypothetical protein